jgi:hypothetical protein
MRIFYPINCCGDFSALFGFSCKISIIVKDLTYSRILWKLFSQLGDLADNIDFDVEWLGDPFIPVLLVSGRLFVSSS